MIGVLVKKGILGAIAFIFVAGFVIASGVGATQTTTPATSPAPVAAAMTSTTPPPSPKPGPMVCPGCDRLVEPQAHCQCSR
jgi:hypothetical protein